MNTSFKKIKKMFDSAEGYSKASLLLSATRDFDVMLPSTIHAALAIEIYFKCLYFILNNNDFKVKDRHSHDFVLLYDTLDINIKKKLSDVFKASINQRDKNQISDIENFKGIKIPLDLRKTLLNWNGIFTDWRYFYDILEVPRSKGKYTLMFHPIEISVKTAIFEACPDLLLRAR